MKTAWLAATALAVPAMIAACAAPGEMINDPDDFAAYQGDPRLGTEVDRICFSRNIDGFGETTDNSVIVEAGVNEHYLIKTFGICSDLEYAQSLSFEQYGSSCLRRGDQIIPYDSVFGPDEAGLPPRSCAIDRIYEWDPTVAVEQGGY
ncbi:MAG: DUF6491 family protein [Oceanicaulis sp.]